MARGNKKEKPLTKTLIVGPFRMAFPSLLEPEETDNGDRYKVTMLFPPDSKSVDEIDDAMAEVMDDYFGEDWPTGKKDILPEDKLFDAGTKTYTGFQKGWMAMVASSQDQPGIVDADKNEVLSKREVYGGRWARAQITIATYDNKAKGVTAYLNHVQLLEHDEAFSGRGNPADVFDKYKLKDDDRDDGDNRRNSRRRGRDDDDDDDDDDDRQAGRSRSRGRGGDRGRDDEDDHKRGRGARSGRGREEDDEEEDRGSRRRSRSRDEDEEDNDDRGSRRSRSRSRDDDGDDKRGSRGGRSSRRSRDEDEDDEWN